jgi:hypothetical protein
MFVNTCSFKSKYWNIDLDKETEFECAEESHNNSQKCIFHDKHFLDDAKSREIIQEQFQKKIEKHLSTSNSEPLLCIGYNLYEIRLKVRNFAIPYILTTREFQEHLLLNANFEAMFPSSTLNS